MWHSYDHTQGTLTALRVCWDASHSCVNVTTHTSVSVVTLTAVSVTRGSPLVVELPLPATWPGLVVPGALPHEHLVGFPPRGCPGVLGLGHCSSGQPTRVRSGNGSDLPEAMRL